MNVLDYLRGVLEAEGIDPSEIHRIGWHVGGVLQTVEMQDFIPVAETVDVSEVPPEARDNLYIELNLPNGNIGVVHYDVAQAKWVSHGDKFEPAFTFTADHLRGTA